MVISGCMFWQSQNLSRRSSSKVESLRWLPTNLFNKSNLSHRILKWPLSWTIINDLPNGIFICVNDITDGISSHFGVYAGDNNFLDITELSDKVKLAIDVKNEIIRLKWEKGCLATFSNPHPLNCTIFCYHSNITPKKVFLSAEGVICWKNLDQEWLIPKVRRKRLTIYIDGTWNFASRSRRMENDTDLESNDDFHMFYAPKNARCKAEISFFVNN